MKLVGITGGIGSGKSFVCRLLQAKGYPVYDCDTEAKRLMVTHPDIIRDMRALLSDAVYEPLLQEGAPVHTDDAGPLAEVAPAYRLNKQLVADYLFASGDHATRINAIVHPRVKEDFLRWAERQNTELVFVESAILKEAHFLDVLDAVLLVSAPDKVRLRRAMTRDRATERQIRLRMSQQQSQASMRKFASFEIVNDGKKDLSASLDTFLQTLLA